MQDLTAKRTLVKSPPELWEELSEVQRLARHLGAFGEITITKLEPEHTVAWEGEHASGTVSIEPSGWGTKVILTAELAANGEPREPDESSVAEPDPAPTAAEADQPPMNSAEPEPEPEPEPELEPPVPIATEPPRRRRGFWSRLFASWLVPEERLNTGALGARDEKLDELSAEEEEPSGDDEGPGADPEPDAQESTEDRAEQAPTPDPETDAQEVIDQERARTVLEETLDALGSAHHRPFSRG
jgi:hypothetical protein